MLKMAWKRIFNRKIISMITVLAMVCIFTIVPLGIHFAQESRLSVEETIEQFGRGSYDILVRPADSRTEIEEKLGVVEENYIGDGIGGISLAEWEEIKGHKDIEIAAPVASIGYFTGNQTNVGLPFLEHPARFIWQYYTSDGINTYMIDEPNVLNYFEGARMEYAEYLAITGTDAGFLGVRIPESFYLLTAIDVESEGDLTGIDFTDLYTEIPFAPDREILESFLEFRGNPDLIPVLQRSDLYSSLYLSLIVEELDISLEDYKERYNIFPDEPTYDEESYRLHEAALKALDEEPALSSEHHDIDLSTSQSPFDSTYVELMNDYKVVNATGGSLKNDTSLYYTASKIQYDIDDGVIEVAKVKEGTPPSYKEVKQQGESYLENLQETGDATAPFMLWQMGTFTPPAEESSLTSSPLGIYTTEKVETAGGTTMNPTIYPGSFIAAPAAGVTTIEAAEIIKGDKPIDAIRIRVAGIDSYNAAAQLKIEGLATDLLEKGYEVDIVAGSSFKKLEMVVEGVGLVTAPWTTLGVAQSLTDSWNMIALLNTVLFALFGVAWFASRLLFERNALAAENDVLYTLGWRKSKIRMRNFNEQQILISTAFIVSILVLLRFNSSEVNFLIPVSLWIVTLGLTAALFTSESKPIARSASYKRWASLIHYRKLIFPTMLVLTISILLIAIQTASLLSSLSESFETSLGEYTIEVTYYLQLTILLATVLLALISIGEAINAILSARKSEFQMYHTIGWTRGMIRKHFSKEVALWAGASIVFGCVIGVFVLLGMEVSLRWIMIGAAAAFLFITIPLTFMVGVRKYR